MKVVVSKQNRRVVAGLIGVSVVSAFVACSGSSEHRGPRDRAQAGQWSGSDAGEAGAGFERGGSPGQAGSGGTSLGGAPETGDGGRAAGAGGELQQAAGAGGVGEGSEGGHAQGGESLGGQPAGGAGGAGGDSAGGAGGDSAGGAGGDSAGGAGGEGPFVDPVCGVGLVQVGAYSLWCGKVNMHLDAQSAWLHDSDCSSGCNIAGVSYCQKFYPNATSVVTVAQVQTKDWKNAGCADSTPDGAGISGQAACCAPF